MHCNNCREEIKLIQGGCMFDDSFVLQSLLSIYGRMKIYKFSPRGGLIDTILQTRTFARTLQLPAIIKGKLNCSVRSLISRIIVPFACIYVALLLFRDTAFCKRTLASSFFCSPTERFKDLRFSEISSVKYDWNKKKEKKREKKERKENIS